MDARKEKCHGLENIKPRTSRFRGNNLLTQPTRTTVCAQNVNKAQLTMKNTGNNDYAPKQLPAVKPFFAYITFDHKLIPFIRFPT